MEHKGQQLPSTGSRFAKPVKEVFVSNNEWIMCGIDFASLEDRIDALKTKDTNKLKVYIDGYDGHSLRAYTYFKDRMPDIELANEKENCYICTVKGKEICFKDTDVIDFQGKKYSGREFYEMVANKKL